MKRYVAGKLMTAPELTYLIQEQKEARNRHCSWCYKRCYRMKLLQRTAEVPSLSVRIPSKDTAQRGRQFKRSAFVTMKQACANQVFRSVRMYACFVYWVCGRYVFCELSLLHGKHIGNRWVQCALYSLYIKYDLTFKHVCLRAFFVTICFLEIYL